MIRYEVCRPTTSDRRDDRNGMVVSRHKSLDRAVRSLKRQVDGSVSQGGFCQDYIWDVLNNVRIT